MKKFWAVFVARNKEFVRDRASFGWSLFFPFLLLLGFGFMLGGDGQDVFKVAVLGTVPQEAQLDASQSEEAQAQAIQAEATQPENGTGFFSTKHVQFLEVDNLEEALVKVGQHRFDLLLDPGTTTSQPRYWINSSSAKGYLTERILWGSSTPKSYLKQEIEGKEVRYIDWLMPGLLSMNMMFGALFGIGYVMVRYRKMGVLRRLKATPLSAFQFLSAQVASRLVLIIATTTIVYVGSNLLLDFQMLGSYMNLALVFILGTMCVISLGLVLAARTASEELAGGLLNLISFPMMLMSGVWFSIDGAPGWVVNVAKIFPLTHVNNAARAVMTDGASLMAIAPQLGALSVMTLVFLTLGAALFRWE